MRSAVFALFCPVLIAQSLISQTLAITDCAVVDPVAATTTPHRTILIDTGRVRSIGPASTVRIPAGARTLPASGKFVIPGLWDMHVHVGEIEEDWFPLYLANGITGLREMAASEKNAPRQRQYQQDLAAGRRVGPDLLWTLSPMDAPAIGDARQARAEVARRAAMGLRYIKVYNQLSREAYFAIADECRRRGLQMVGHIPDRVSAREVARAGQASVEHLDNLLLACSRREAEARWLMERNQSISWRMLLDSFDSAKADALLDSFRAGRVWQTPTLIVHEVAALAQERRLPGDFPVSFARRDYLRSWPREALEGPLGGLDADSARRLFTVFQDLVRRMDQRGVRLLAGTDTPGPYCVPGFALHHELALLVQSGLSPAAALRAATTNPREFLQLPRDAADLVILDANPLDSISNTQRIHAVIKHGRVFDSAALKSMLDRVRSNVSK